MEQVLINLMENSAQAMTRQAEPKIVLSVSRNTEGEIVFTVEDNGDGIPAEEMDDIWGHGTSGRQSSGMGLAFVRTAVEKMHGHIAMESTEGRGTAISLILPEEGEETE